MTKYDGPDDGIKVRQPSALVPSEISCIRKSTQASKCGQGVREALCLENRLSGLAKRM